MPALNMLGSMDYLPGEEDERAMALIWGMAVKGALPPAARSSNKATFRIPESAHARRTTALADVFSQSPSVVGLPT